ncbi:MAG TPA: DNA-3-methyladenine glycosylase I [Nitrososphaeraceae archaeon]|nr:DNA-3-methyladenine glycosylase I [Nitrososphaeraceae archaeon]
MSTSVEISEKVSMDLKKRGFTLVGPVICYALMQVIVMVNADISQCLLYQK